ncbi:STAS domain-containing protein [Streptomyces tsukubensis]|uniref:Anti-sigma factor antagonist n=1 Tax=Streptomyces tsukubensis TaxID=83656 RepID=A0A1V4A0Z7_9ACTN|nr:STAS domain-containing protein [Streptomyces tsukubensis]OON72171.1 hypothetical protein B1H18_30710 [Streptomyces tsukubensis]
MTDHQTLSRTRPAEHRVVCASGELDLVTVPELAERLHSAMRSMPVARVVVDLRDVTFADAALLGLLCPALPRAVESGGWLRLVYTKAILHRLLQATDLTDTFPCYPTPEAAAEGRYVTEAAARRT